MGNDALATLIIGSVIIYLFREPETVVAPPVGGLVVVEQEESAHPPVLTGVSDEPDLQPLTPRELEVLRLLALGWENEYIAAAIASLLSPTGTAHIQRIHGRPKLAVTPNDRAHQSRLNRHRPRT